MPKKPRAPRKSVSADADRPKAAAKPVDPDDDITTIIGGTPEMALPGSKEYDCYKCGVGVWLAPSGQAVVVREKARAMCLACAAAHLPKDTELRVPSISDILSDLLGTRKQ